LYVINNIQFLSVTSHNCASRDFGLWRQSE